MMMEDKAVFLDTNVLVYASVAEAPFHNITQEKIQDLKKTKAEFWISRQILREYLVTLTRPQLYMKPPSTEMVIESIHYYSTSFRIAEDGPQITEKLLQLMEQVPIGGKQIHDANIVATMKAYKITTLLTHNVRDFQRFSEWITLLPLNRKTQ